MCGRYTLRARLNELLAFFAAESQLDWLPRFNIAPTQPVAVVRLVTASGVGNSCVRELALLRWGLVPRWADDPAVGNRLINARAETIAEKPSFREAFQKRRCLVLADGFYEWRTSGRDKQPYFIRRKDDRPFAFAGLWERWTKADRPLETCTIITTEPNALMAGLHDRMPVILPNDAARRWLELDGSDLRTVQPLLVPYPHDDLEAYPVDTLVNSPKHDRPECIAPLKSLLDP